MKTSPLKTTLALLFLALAACTYEPEEVYFKEVPQLEPDVALSLNAYDAVDTIFLWNEASFTYALQQGAGKLERVEVLLDNNVVKTDNAQSGGFSIRRYGENNRYLKTGAHELKIQFIASTGSGSLADVAGAEKFQVWRTWTIMIDVDPPPAPEITFSIENGFLKLNWPKYTKPNFSYYYVFRRDENNNGTYKKISDPQQNYWIDSTYVGGYSRPYEYQVTTYAFDQRSGKVLSKNDQYTFGAGKLNPNDSSITVKWSKNKYYGALKEYTVSESGGIAHRTTAIGDTTATVKLKSLIFGRENLVFFNAVPRYKPVYVPSSSRNISVILGDRMKHSGMKMVFNQDLNLYVGHYPGTSTSAFFHTYSPQLAPMDSIAVPYGSSFIPCRGSKVYYYAFSEHAVIDLPTKNKRTRSTGYYVSNFRGSKDGVVSYSREHRNPSNGQWLFTSTVFDLANSVELFSESRTAAHSYVISEDGSFIRTYPDNKLLKVAGGTTTTVGTINFTFMEFRADKPSEILAERNGFIDVYNANDLSLIRSIPLPFGNNYLFKYTSYDPVSKHMVWQDASTSKIYLVHIETGASKTYKFNGIATLANGTFFHSNGYYLKVL